jgi:hypothetical protein
MRTDARLDAFDRTTRADRFYDCYLAAVAILNEAQASDVLAVSREL